VLYADRAIELERIGPDPTEPTSADLWVRTDDLPRVNGFSLEPGGACGAGVCIPISADLIRDGFFNLSVFAAQAGQIVVAEPEARVWSLGAMPTRAGAADMSRIAPDLELPDRLGRPTQLAAFRGKKALLVTWSSW
jgi:hypothetical protein